MYVFAFLLIQHKVQNVLVRIYLRLQIVPWDISDIHTEYVYNCKSF